jgi:hypothetical protein
MGKIEIIPSENGQVVNVNVNKPEYGYVRVKQSVSKINANGWLSSETRYLLINGRLEELQNSGFTVDTKLPGKLVREESLEPFTEYSTPKVAGDSGVICSYQGQPIYSRVAYDPTGTKDDVLIAHDNKDEIVNALMNKNNNIVSAPISVEEAFETESNTTEEEVVKSKVDNSLNEEVEIEETINEFEEVEDLDTDFTL